MSIGKKIQNKKRKIFLIILNFLKKNFKTIYLFFLKLGLLKKLKKIYKKKQIILKFGNDMNKINKFEYKVTSQNNEDGLIDHILSKLKTNNFFVEVGFDFVECNSLNLIKKGFDGILIDGNEESCKNLNTYIEKYFNKQNVIAINKFVNKHNIKDIIENKEIDFFSIDIDGNDYWVLSELNLDKIKLICCEYNAFLGNIEKRAIYYNAEHIYRNDFYFGASLCAYTDLLNKKNFDLIAVDTSGTNAFFINKKYSHLFDVLSPNSSYKECAHYSKDILNSFQSDKKNFQKFKII